jgi:hypothetical protein
MIGSSSFLVKPVRVEQSWYDLVRRWYHERGSGAVSLF